MKSMMWNSDICSNTCVHSHVHLHHDMWWILLIEPACMHLQCSLCWYSIVAKSNGAYLVMIPLATGSPYSAVPSSHSQTPDIKQIVFKQMSWSIVSKNCVCDGRKQQQTASPSSMIFNVIDEIAATSRYDWWANVCSYVVCAQIN